MLYTGEFLNLHNQTVSVQITTGGSTAKAVVIGTDATGLWFADDPVTITSGVSSDTDHLLRHGAEIRLLARDFREDLFARSAREATVRISVGGTCLFSGFIEPQTYSQPYNELYDELTLNCIDALSALQYEPYGGTGADYAALRRAATTRDMWSILSSLLARVTTTLPAIWYDGSKTLTATGAANIFPQILISELLFLGDGENDVWTCEEVLDEMMRYLDLRILQQGQDFYIFSAGSLAGSATLTFRNIATGSTGTVTKTFPRTPKLMTSAMAADTDAQISIGEVFNRIELTCDTTPMDTLVENPLDESSLTSPYTARQLYLDDYSLCVAGMKEADAWQMMTDMMEGRPVQHDSARHSRWYLRVMDHPGWRFPGGSGVADMVEAYCRGNANQQKLPYELSRRIGAGLIAWGKEEVNVDGKDDTVTGRLSMNRALVINVPGNDYITEALAYPDAAALQAAAPVAVYEGNTSGGVFSPADDGTVNYIIFSGKITLNPVALVTLTNAGGGSSRAVVPGPEEGKSYYRVQHFWKAAIPTATPSIDTACGSSWPPKATSQIHTGAGYYSWPGLQPFTETGPRLLKYNFASAGDWTDTVSKLGVVACMLRIGGKCLVEEGYDGAVSRFKWKTFKERSACADDDEYYAQSFTIGINPKLGDYIIGTEFPIGNNITLDMGLDTEGMAVPIRRSDALSGAVRFEILGPVNLTWDNVTRRHPTWFRHTAWTTTTVPVLPSLSNIILSDFDIKLQSDNGRVDLLDPEDLVYVSDTDETFENVRDDLTFRLTSALTADEARELGVPVQMMLSTPVDATTGLGLTAIYDHTKGALVKPEKSYVDTLYNRLHLPRITLEQSLEDTAGNVSPFSRYELEALPGRIFWVQSIERNLRQGTARLTLRESWL
ncbi:MAG: hypothetical protein HDR80_04835 [Bacteroides sp.]|nr:hypothetical protein [Bacteroides sp.]